MNGDKRRNGGALRTNTALEMDMRGTRKKSFHLVFEGRTAKKK